MKDHYKAHTPYKCRVVLLSLAGHIQKTGPDLRHRKHCGRGGLLRESAVGLCLLGMSAVKLCLLGTWGAGAWENHD